MRKFLLNFTLAACTTMVFGATLVVPNENRPFSGNASEPFPKGQQSIELQELLGSGQFHSNPMTISAISFRAAPGSGPVNVTVGSLSVTLSSSPNSPNGGGKPMSSTFANNVGADKTVVFSGNNVVLNDTGCQQGPPCPFDITVTFQTPFVYTPSKGALLVDMVFTNLNATSGVLDAMSFPAPGGNVANVIGAAGSAAGTFAYQGAIVQFTYTTTAPLITGVVNVAGNIPPGVPNYGIAQGALFAVYGSNMGPADLTVAQLPLPTTAGLAGTTATIAMNGTVVNAPIFFTRSDVVVGVMPSNAPRGNGNLTLVYNGQSGTMPVTVRLSNFGISNVTIPFANNNVGVISNAAVTFPSTAQTVSATNTAAPGDVLTVWGTGLGATPNNGGDTNAPPGGNIGSAPQVFVGGIPSPSVSYWGRSPGSIPGLDQINFQVPPDAPLGCNVSIVVQTSNNGTPIVSNAPTIALSGTDGGTCSDPTQLVLSSPTANGVKVLSVGLQQFINITTYAGPPDAVISGKARVDVLQLTQSQIVAVAPEQNVAPSFGTCYVGINPDPNANDPFMPTGLDAGPTIILNPPSGPAVAASENGTGFYRKDLGTGGLALGAGFTLPSGTWNVSNGAGGADVGPLSFRLPVPQPITWTNRDSLIGGTIDRTQPLTITWSGGDSNGYVDIQGYTFSAAPLSFADQNGFFFVGFECSAPVAAGQFSIPPSILLGMPPNPSPSSNLQVSTFALPNLLGNVPGFDIGVTDSRFQTQIPVGFK